ncbi:MAG: WHG domain-containing protein [Solirubrobacterales bacterium]|nr:WHG domain-containing protein [Solirubrobacterales bacterium]
MTARRITKRVGSSSMAIYSEFGSMAELVRSVVDHGFDLLAAELASLELSHDPLANFYIAGQLTRAFARNHRHLYAVMFAAEQVGSVERRGEELLQGVETLQYMHQLCVSAYEAGLLKAGHPREITLHMWTLLHGHLMLELAGYMAWDASAERTFAQTIYRALLAFGADPVAAKWAVS